MLFLLLVMLRPVAAAAAAMASSNIDEEAGATKADRASHVSAETEELGEGTSNETKVTLLEDFLEAPDRVVLALSWWGVNEWVEENPQQTTQG